MEWINSYFTTYLQKLTKSHHSYFLNVLFDSSNQTISNIQTDNFTFKYLTHTLSNNILSMAGTGKGVEGNGKVGT